jgi:WD40 repeat protein
MSDFVELFEEYLKSNQSQAGPVYLYGHTAGIKGLINLPGGKIISWSWDDTIRIWDATTASSSASLDHFEVEGVSVLDDTRIASWSYWDHSIRLWDVEKGTLLAEMTGDGGRVLAVRLLDDGHVMSWSEDGTTRVWESTGSLISTMQSGCAVECNP